MRTQASKNPGHGSGLPPPGAVPSLHDKRDMPAGSTLRMWGAKATATAKPAPARKGQGGKGGKGGKGGTGGEPGAGGAKPARRRPLWLTLLKWGAIVSAASVALLVATVAFVFWMYGRDPNLPDFESLADYQPRQVIEVLDANGARIGVVYGPDKIKQRRTIVAFDELPPHVVDAFVAAEDNRFWTHSGIDYWGMFRAFIANLRSGRKKQGASTITQQVVKNLLLTPEKTFKRKIQEIILARRLEKALTKEEIVMLYMNEINFGEDNYGIQEAARFYFGKPAKDLSVGEAALLAGIPQRPEAYSPRRDAAHRNNKFAKDRQIYVLNQLVEMNKLTKEEAQKWIDQPIRLVERPFPQLDTAPEWVTLARGELVAELARQDKPEAALNTLGGTVRTTLDPGLQQEAQRALQRGLRAVDKRLKVGRPVRSVKPGAVDAEIAKLAKKLPGAPKGKDVYEAVVTAVSDAELDVDLGKWPAKLALGGADDARFNAPDDDGKVKTAAERFKVGDVVEVIVATGGPAGKDGGKRVAFAPGPEGAVVVLEVGTRKVRALVGGYAIKLAGLNRATQARRQPGSSFKPFVYAAGIERGLADKRDPTTGQVRYTAGSIVNDTPERFEKWLPKNYDAKNVGDMPLREALARSINTISIKIAFDTTPEAVADLARRAGIASKLPSGDLSIALGSGEVTPLELTNALATFAAGGKLAPPRFLDAINGVTTPPQPAVEVIKPEVAYVVTNLMESVVTSGTARLARSLKIPIAGKTGTSNDARDVWFVGVTPDYAVGVWIGYDDNRSMKREAGGTAAVPVFVDVMKAMNQPAKAFKRPPGVVDVKIDRKTGNLAPEGAPPETVLTEVFIEGTAPALTAALPGEITNENQVKGEYADDYTDATD